MLIPHAADFENIFRFPAIKNRIRQRLYKGVKYPESQLRESKDSSDHEDLSE
jgi:hypothetical protein